MTLDPTLAEIAARSKPPARVEYSGPSGVEVLDRVAQNLLRDGYYVPADRAYLVRLDGATGTLSEVTARAEIAKILGRAAADRIVG